MLARRLQHQRRLVLLLDYDGTLVPFADEPEHASPDGELFTLLIALAHRPDTAVHLVTGRPRDTVEQWFGKLPISLWAEHGFWHRASPKDIWRHTLSIGRGWMQMVRPRLERYVETTPGSSIEEKDASLVWHYRNVDSAIGEKRARALRRALVDTLRDQPVKVLPGNKVVEIRPRGVNKAAVVHRILAREDPTAVLVAIGDDQTDEDMFAALPGSGVSLQVGRRRTDAMYRMPNWKAVRVFLKAVMSGK